MRMHEETTRFTLQEGGLFLRHAPATIPASVRARYLIANLVAKAWGVDAECSRSGARR
jgi:hypothetical protein